MPRTPTLVDFSMADPRAVLHAAASSSTRRATQSSRLFGRDSVGSKVGSVSSTPATNDEQKVAGSIALLRMLARNSSRFFLGVGLSSTHVMRPGALCSRGAVAAFGDSAMRPEVLNGINLPPRRAAERKPPLVTWPNYDLKASFAMGTRKRGMSPTEARLAIASYRACASHVDVQIGRLIDALDELNLAATTAIVAHSDGFPGPPRRWSKYSLYESMRVPPIAGAVVGAREVVDELVGGTCQRCSTYGCNGLHLHLGMVRAATALIVLAWQWRRLQKRGIRWHLVVTPGRGGGTAVAEAVRKE